MDNEIRQKILDLVHSRPRAIAEISDAIKKNWRTADRYVEQLVKEDLINVHVFRKGGRGAIKVAYWPTSITTTPSAVKSFLLQRILNGVKRDDFSPLDIVQHVAPQKRKTIAISKETYHGQENLADFLNSLNKAENQILFLSGNLSFIDLGNNPKVFFDLFSRKLRAGVNLYFLTRADYSNDKVIHQLLQLNNSSNKGKAYVRYTQQPLRCTIVDEKEFSIKEIIISTEINDTFVYYVYDEQWIKWMIDIFWYMWHGSIDAGKRLDVLGSLIKR